MTVDPAKPRILYIEGEPKWEFKFIRRAIELDQSLQLVYHAAHHAEQDLPAGHRQADGTGAGFPGQGGRVVRVTRAVIIGGVEANYFTPTQQELLKQFVDRRGGGVLWLGGRGGLCGWRLGRVAAGRSAADRAARIGRTRSIAIRQTWN